MRTKKEIRKKTEKDLQFIISAVTTELGDMAYLRYFNAWEQNGGMGWFFDECVEITHKIMLTEGSAYMKWLDYWATFEGDDWVTFSELIGECFDWYHMSKAKVEFMSRYEKDECTKEQISEHMGYLINSFEVAEDRDDLLDRAISFASENRERKRVYAEKKEAERLEREAKLTVNDPRVQQVIDTLNELEVDGESMEHIIDKVGMTDQMIKQLYLDKNN